MKVLKEVRKEDDAYYQGAFWIIGNSVKEIKSNNYRIIGKQILSNYNGDYIENIKSKNSLTHRKLWNSLNPLEDKQIPWNFFPRGRVSIYNGIAYIHLNSLFNQPSIVDSIIKIYHLEKLGQENIQVDLNDTYQGSHYDFLLK